MLMPMRLIGLGTADDVDIGSTWSTTTITVSTRQSMANKSRESWRGYNEREMSMCAFVSVTQLMPNPHPVREIQTVSRCVFGEIRERKMVNQPKVRDDHPPDCVDVNKPLDCDLTTFLIILPELIESAQHPWYPS